MKFYRKYIELVEKAGKIEIAWFTSFNLDPELLERYLLPPISSKQPSDLRTVEDYEAMNVALEGINIKVWYDFRAMNQNGFKRTTVDLLPVDPAQMGAVLFHPKVVFIRGDRGAWLICGSANLSFSAWSSNREAVVVREVKTQHQGLSIEKFFSALDGGISVLLQKWIGTLRKDHLESDWDFLHSFSGPSLLSSLSPAESLTVWSPYFSLDLYGLVQDITKMGIRQVNIVPDISAFGRVRIDQQQFNLILENRLVSFKKDILLDVDTFTHAKVFLTESNIAIGSWNLTRKALMMNVLEAYNIEAGMVLPISSVEVDTLTANLRPLDAFDISTMDRKELQAEWEGMLCDYSLKFLLIADWATFTYCSNDEVPIGYTISLPDLPSKNVPLEQAIGRKFSRRFDSVLANKVYTIYDNNGEVAYLGYILEINTENRPVQGYFNLDDLLEALLRSPLSNSANSNTIYRFGEETGGNEEMDLGSLLYFGQQSYHRLFVAFQLLYDEIQRSSNDLKKLDQLTYRLPGSLIQVRLLLSRLVERLEVEDRIQEETKDQSLFLWFACHEFNRNLLEVQGLGRGKEIDLLPEVQVSRHNILSREDRSFMKKLIKTFGYEI